MKITLLPKEERQYKDLGYVQLYFSFRPDFEETKRKSFRILYNLDESLIPPASKGFKMHPHQDMEVVTLMREGELHHKDTVGNIGITKSIAVQVITSGTGILHEEYNPSSENIFRGVQMFLHPKEKGLQPKYSKMEFTTLDYTNKLATFVSPNNNKKELQIANDAYMKYGIFTEEQTFIYKLENPENGVFIKALSGEVSINENKLIEKDEIGIENISEITIFVTKGTEILLWELP